MDYRTFFDLANVMMVVLDDHQRVAMINPKGCEILGYAMKDVVCKNWFDHFLPVNERKKAEKAWQGISKGQIQPFIHIENHILTKTGQKRLIDWHNTYLKDPQGHVRFTIGSGEDVTEQRKPHHCAQFVCDPKGIVLDANSHALKKLGIAKSSLVSHSVFNLCAPNSKIKMRANFVQTLKRGFSAYSVDLIRKNHEVLPAHFFSSALGVGGNKVVIVSCF